MHSYYITVINNIEYVRLTDCNEFLAIKDAEITMLRSCQDEVDDGNNSCGICLMCKTEKIRHLEDQLSQITKFVNSKKST